MPVNREFFKRWITKSEAPPHWPCPRCGGGHFRLVSESLFEENDADTKRSANHDAFDHDWVKMRFVAALRCDNTACKEVAVVAGRGIVDIEPTDDGSSYSYVDFFMPQYFWPSPALIAVPASTPTSVREKLDLSFAAIWGDPSASSVHIRNAVEDLCTSLKIPKTTLKSGKRKRLTLHERISKLKDRSKQTHDYLMAIKWLGNAGVHDAPFTLGDVCDALDIFEEVLIDLYSGRPQVRDLVNRVNARRAPARKAPAKNGRR